MQLLEEVLIGVAVCSSTLILTGVGGDQLSSSGIVDNCLEMRLGNIVERNPVGTTSVSGSVILLTHGFESQRVTIAVGTGREVTTTCLISTSLESETANEAIDIST